MISNLPWPATVQAITHWMSVSSHALLPTSSKKEDATMFIAIWLAVAPLIMTDASWLAAAPAAKAPTTAKSAKPAQAPKATSEQRWTPETVDDAWATKVLADPTYDRGWYQSCEEDWDNDLVSVCEVRELDYAPGERPVAIRGGANGGMAVIGSDRKAARVIYRIRARARTEEDARELAQEVRVEVDNGVIRPRGPSTSSSKRWDVEVKAWVPRSTDLSLSTTNGPIGVSKVTGTMDIQSVNGPVSLRDLSGAVYARVQNGPLQVLLTGTKWTGAGLDAAAQNGPVNLWLPKSYSAKLETGTINGPSDIEYPLTIEGRLRGHFTTTLGSGGAMVRVVTDNGPIHIAQR